MTKRGGSAATSERVMLAAESTRASCFAYRKPGAQRAILALTSALSCRSGSISVREDRLHACSKVGVCGLASTRSTAAAPAAEQRGVVAECFSECAITELRDPPRAVAAFYYKGPPGGRRAPGGPRETRCRGVVRKSHPDETADPTSVPTEGFGAGGLARLRAA